MPSPQKVATVALPIPRHRQLSLLAALRGVGLGDVIGQFINAAIAAGELPDVVPGVEVGTIIQDVTGEPKVTLQIDDYQSVMSSNVALQLASALEDPNRGRLLLSTVIENPNVVGWDTLRVFGRGLAIVIESQRGSSVNMAPAIARDVARQLRKVAAVVAPQEAARPQPTITGEQKPNGGTLTIVDLDSIA